MKTVLYDSFFGLLNKTLYFSLRLFVIFLISKEASYEDFGSFIYILNIVEMSRLFLDFGVDTTFNRVLAKSDDAEAQVWVEKVLSLKIVLSLALSVLLILGFFLAGISNDILLLFVTCSVLPFISANTFINIYFQSKNNNKQIFKFYLIAFLLSLPFIYFLREYVAFYTLYFFIEVSFFLLLLIAIRSKLTFNWKISDFKSYKHIYQLSFFAGSSQTVSTIYNKTDIIFIEKLSSGLVLAHYGFFVRVLDPFLMIASALATSAYSFFSRHLDDMEERKAKRRLHLYLLVTSLYAVFILVAITVLMPILLTAFNSKFLLDNSLAFLFGLVTATRIISAALASIILSLGKFNQVFRLSVINMIMLFPLFFLLIPQYGISGVLISIIISEFANVLIKVWYLKSRLF